MALQPQLPMPPSKLCWFLFIARLPLLAVRLSESSFLHSPSVLSTPSCLSAAATTILHPHPLTPFASHLQQAPNWIQSPAPLLRSDRRSTNHPCWFPACCVAGLLVWSFFSLTVRPLARVCLPTVWFWYTTTPCDLPLRLHSTCASSTDLTRLCDTCHLSLSFVNCSSGSDRGRSWFWILSTGARHGSSLAYTLLRTIIWRTTKRTFPVHHSRPIDSSRLISNTTSSICRLPVLNPRTSRMACPR